LGIYGIEDADNNDVNHKIEQDSYDHESEPQRAYNGVILLEDIALFSYSIGDYTIMLIEKADQLNKLGKGLEEEIIGDYAVTTLRSRSVRSRLPVCKRYESTYPVTRVEGRI
jgi:hypothetical protein